MGENVLILYSFLKDSFTGYGILCWQLFFSFSVLKMSFHYLLACFISDKKSRIIPLCVMFLFFSFWLTSRFSLYLWFQQFDCDVLRYSFLCFLLEFSELGSMVYFLSLILKNSWHYPFKYFVPTIFSFPAGIPSRLSGIIPQFFDAWFVFFASQFFFFSFLCFDLDTFYWLIFKFIAPSFCCVRSAASYPYLK